MTIKKDGLLMIHPQGGCESETVLDSYVLKMAGALKHAMKGASLRGWHTCTGCHEAHSGSTILYVMLDGEKVETNSLAVHYLACHRGSVPQEELEKVSRLEYEAEVPGPGVILRPHKPVLAPRKATR